MKKILLSILAAIAVITTTAQKTINDPNAQKRNVSGFHAIDVGGGIDLYLTQGDEAVAVSASETKFRDRIKTEVVNGVLKIKYEYDKSLNISFNGTKKNLKAYVSCRNLDKLHAGGGSDVRVEGVFKVAKLDLGISGGSDFDGKVEAGELKADASGGSDINISGTATSIAIEASGGSDFKGFNFVVDNCTVEASGGSDVSITANKEINAETSGGSDIRYKGNAVIRNIRTSGGGSIKKSSK
jgi:hypothetical protein